VKESEVSQSNSGLSVVLIVVALLSLGMAIWYLIPGIYHPLVFSGDPNEQHIKHAALFLALAVLSGIAVRFVRPSMR
jgi:hypothetical protein